MRKALYIMLFVLSLLLMAGCGRKDAANAPEDTASGRENTLSISFPADQDGRNAYNSKIYDTKPFSVKLALPAGWETRQPAAENRGSDDNFYTKVALYNKEAYMGFVGFNIYTPAGEEVPKEDYYKTVYSSLRLGSMYIWDQYTPVKTTETTETATATVNYKDPEKIDENPGAMAEVPFIEVPGILAYDKNMLVYVGIQFAENAVTDEEVRQIAESLVLEMDK